MYKDWLYLACKWATKGLDHEEFRKWNKLSAKLDKHCPACKEGYICESCHDSGLKLTALEKMLFKNIEMSLDANKVNAVN